MTETRQGYAETIKPPQPKFSMDTLVSDVTKIQVYVSSAAELAALDKLLVNLVSEIRGSGNPTSVIRDKYDFLLSRQGVYVTADHKVVLSVQRSSSDKLKIDLTMASGATFEEHGLRFMLHLCEQKPFGNQTMYFSAPYMAASSDNVAFRSALKTAAMAKYGHGN